ncbi:MAG: hypothetical protein VYA34_11170, partial [Myxococcota bacterium]|nr:hypothetical protein [Myxococcota bacterium]
MVFQYDFNWISTRRDFNSQGFQLAGFQLGASTRGFQLAGASTRGINSQGGYWGINSGESHRRGVIGRVFVVYEGIDWLGGW